MSTPMILTMLASALAFILAVLVGILTSKKCDCATVIMLLVGSVVCLLTPFPESPDTYVVMVYVLWSFVFMAYKSVMSAPCFKCTLKD